MVFGTASANPDYFTNLALNPALPTQGDVITVTADLTGTPDSQHYSGGTHGRKY